MTKNEHPWLTRGYNMFKLMSPIGFPIDCVVGGSIGKIFWGFHQDVIFLWISAVKKGTESEYFCCHISNTTLLEGVLSQKVWAVLGAPKMEWKMDFFYSSKVFLDGILIFIHTQETCKAQPTSQVWTPWVWPWWPNPPLPSPFFSQQCGFVQRKGRAMPPTSSSVGTMILSACCTFLYLKGDLLRFPVT